MIGIEQLVILHVIGNHRSGKSQINDLVIGEVYKGSIRKIYQRLTAPLGSPCVVQIQNQLQSVFIAEFFQGCCVAGIATGQISNHSPGISGNLGSNCRFCQRQRLCVDIRKHGLCSHSGSNHSIHRI